MIKVKHLMDASETDDGQRIWIEPISLTRDLREWCKVEVLMPQVAPERKLWDWYEEHPDAWEEFRGRYHVSLSKSSHKPTLQQMARKGMKENFTLLHQGSANDRNSAEALAQFIHELEAYIKRDE